MNGLIYLNTILVYNLFPFQILCLCNLKVQMIQLKTSYCSFYGKI